MDHRQRLRDLPLVILALFVAASLPETHPLAAVLEVDHGGPSPYHTIQSAINAAVAGTDSVLVHCGIYQENVTMRDRVNLTGAGAACTAIDGGANGQSAVRMVGVSSSTFLKGFTITNGRSALGGGIYVESGSPLITLNVITGNRAVASGGSGGYGGGIHVTSPVGGESLLVTAPTISRNIIRANSADRFGGGMEIYTDDGTTVANNLIKENTAVQAGGGIDTYQSFPTILNNTIVRNCQQGVGTACVQGGGGISLTNSGVVAIGNNLIAFNEAAIGGGGVDMAASTATFQSNDAYLNTPVNYSGVANPTGSNGNVSVDPLLDTEANSFSGHQPRSNSPLVEATSTAPANDLPGIPRPVDADADGTAKGDIGARENEGITRVRFTSRTSLTWDTSAGPLATYNLYRGDIQTLRTTGIYTQDPNTVPGARRQCALGSPSATDLNTPALGKAFFYLAVVKRAAEGTLGFNSLPSERPYTNANRCP